MTRGELTVVADGRFLFVRVTNLGAAATFSGIVQPGRGTASAAIAKPALWHDSTEADRRIETGQSALFRIAQRDRPPEGNEDPDGRHVHPEGSQAWRMCFLKKGIGAAVERVCPVTRRDGSTEHDGVVITVMANPPLHNRKLVKSVEFEGERAVDTDSGHEYT